MERKGFVHSLLTRICTLYKMVRGTKNSTFQLSENSPFRLAEKSPFRTPVKLSYHAQVTANELNIRKGAGNNFATNGSIKDKGPQTVTWKSAQGLIFGSFCGIIFVIYFLRMMGIRLLWVMELLNKTFNRYDSSGEEIVTSIIGNALVAQTPTIWQIFMLKL